MIYKKHKNHSPRSLFFHLVFILIAGALTINGAIYLYFRLSYEGPDAHARKHLDRYTGYLVRELGSPPLAGEAQKLQKELNIEIAFFPSSQSGLKPWKTSSRLPAVTFSKKKDHGFYHGYFYKIQHTPQGDIIFFTSRKHQFGGVEKAIPLFIFLSVVILFAWLILRKLLLPLKQIEKAFDDVSAGNMHTRLKLKRPRELAKTAEGFNRMVKRISEMMETREQMLRDMSHELRSPLTRLKLAMGFLPASDDKNSAMEDIKILENLITEILESYRSPRSEILKTGKMNPSGATERIITRARKVYRNISISGDLVETDFQVELDFEKWSRVIMNLIENAIKWGKAQKVEIRLLRRDSSFVWQIQDDGKGISAPYREKIFEPFFQADPARTPDKKGFGIGLHLCRTIVESHGGTIVALESKPKGALFEIILPFEK